MTDDTAWLDKEELSTWMRLIAVLTTVPSAIDAQLRRDASINFFEYSILVSLERSPGHAQQLCSLAQFSFGSASRISHAVSRLEKQGWVERRTHAGDVRAVEAVLTEAGLAKLRTAAPDHVREARRLVIDVLTPEQRAHLVTIADQLLHQTMPQAPRMIDDALRSYPHEDES
ncbi:MarR family winged helix-turn-helix transcriptional regulator [Actinoplanes sp. NPDC051859]|uniref:MarR family winged helix-turn-helix transcriptional regulator n=1 Tax=Actinoplanes sp. NPDC051859 TaxID=3363909 RepID=UPI00378DA94F